jgi:hypothetical protein
VGIRNGAKSSDELREHILKCNDKFTRRFGLVIRDSPMQKVGDLIALELEQMGYILRKSSGYQLTEKGNNLATDLENNAKAMDAVIRDFMPTMVSTFDDIQIFLKKVLDLEDGIFIPKVPGIFDLRGMKSNDRATYLKLCRDYISSKWNWGSPLQWDDDLLTKKIEYWVKESTSPKPYDIAKAAYRDYFLSQYFKEELGDVKYKIIRDRLQYFGLVNYSEHLSEFDGEIMYPLIWNKQKVPYAKPMTLLGNAFYSSNPSWKDISAEFLSTLWQTHKSLPGAGFVPVMDLRDKVCFILRISDMSFDNLLKRARIEGQRGKTKIRIYADPSDLSARETSKKRMPIDFGADTGMGVRTLISLSVYEQKS